MDGWGVIFCCCDNYPIVGDREHNVCCCFTTWVGGYIDPENKFECLTPCGSKHCKRSCKVTKSWFCGAVASAIISGAGNPLNCIVLLANQLSIEEFAPTLGPPPEGDPTPVETPKGGAPTATINDKDIAKVGG